ncbi:MAG: hypothetical protein WAW85_15985 [Gordonia sp. (in: high G+C Gram-positive bacteria)]|uniref:hypothetical protein n=1 Tax=Gordonia sp. (in: high G+C Gram-positive bacteria) TaxID=84139 RepID=UPI003BB4F917
MKKFLKRATLAVAAAGALGASTLMAPAPAQAAAPGDLQIIGGVNCIFKPWGPNWTSGPIWQMNRFLGVTNTGDFRMTNVRVTEFNGPTKAVPARKGVKTHGADGKTITVNTQPGELWPGQTYIAIDNKWRGCWPASISGFTIGNEVENPLNNVGYWENVDRKALPRSGGN